MAEAWGGVGFRVETVGELRTALVDAGKTPSFVIIEVMVNPDDLSPVTRKYIQASVGKKR
jgi:thiamine pyrophosphate-dependent acetolactate synthase large subunit-like protein